MAASKTRLGPPPSASPARTSATSAAPLSGSRSRPPRLPSAPRVRGGKHERHALPTSGGRGPPVRAGVGDPSTFGALLVSQCSKGSRPPRPVRPACGLQRRLRAPRPTIARPCASAPSGFSGRRFGRPEPSNTSPACAERRSRRERRAGARKAPRRSSGARSRSRRTRTARPIGSPRQGTNHRPAPPKSTNATRIVLMLKTLIDIGRPSIQFARQHRRAARSDGGGDARIVPDDRNPGLGAFWRLPGVSPFLAAARQWDTRSKRMSQASRRTPPPISAIILSSVAFEASQPRNAGGTARPCVRRRNLPPTPRPHTVTCRVSAQGGRNPTARCESASGGADRCTPGWSRKSSRDSAPCRRPLPKSQPEHAQAAARGQKSDSVSRPGRPRLLAFAGARPCRAAPPFRGDRPAARSRCSAGRRASSPGVLSLVAAGSPLSTCRAEIVRGHDQVSKSAK